MKKIIAWILAMVMVLALLTGCRAKKAEEADHESQAASELQQTEENLDAEDIVVINGEIILPEDELEDVEELETEQQEMTEPTQPAETSTPETAPKETVASGSNGGIELPEDEI